MQACKVSGRLVCLPHNTAHGFPFNIRMAPCLSPCWPFISQTRRARSLALGPSLHHGSQQSQLRCTHWLHAG